MSSKGHEVTQKGRRDEIKNVFVREVVGLSEASSVGRAAYRS